jgi:hypothetical protein
VTATSLAGAASWRSRARFGVDACVIAGGGDDVFGWHDLGRALEPFESALPRRVVHGTVNDGRAHPSHGAQ